MTVLVINYDYSCLVIQDNALKRCQNFIILYFVFYSILLVMTYVLLLLLRIRGLIYTFFRLPNMVEEMQNNRQQ
jgi:hypothetical protein